MPIRHASCSCGRLTVRTLGEPIRISVCHCLACQQRTGSVFGAQARFPADAVTIEGQSTEYVRTADSGNAARFHFCAVCGSTVFYRMDAAPDVVAIPVGAFADPGFPSPRVSIYEERQHPWVQLVGDIEHIDWLAEPRRASRHSMNQVPSIAQWIATWAGLDVPSTAALDDAYDELIARYSEPHRKYHTLRHLDECLSTFAEYRTLAEHPAEVEVALWFHDAIYDTRSNRNEVESAALAAATVFGAGLSAACAQRIENLVMATRHDAIPAGADAKVLVDVDLSILAAAPGRFDEYERQVRAEYAWVPGYLFRKERRKILHGFLARPAIFSTLEFRARHEAQALANIKRSLEALGGQRR